MVEVFHLVVFQLLLNYQRFCIGQQTKNKKQHDM